MKRNVYVSYDGNCPSCGSFQSSKRPENVDIECWKCSATKGKILYVQNIKGYEDQDNTIEIAIETPENIIIIRDYNPEILINKKKDIESV